MDTDVCVAPERLAEAARRLTENARFLGAVDLHEGVADLQDRSWEEILRRSRTAVIGPVQARLLGPEDQLRHLCLHLMRHGAYRPLWLCDIAAALEAAAPDFDWPYFLSGARRLTAWVRCALGLARQLLGARTSAPARLARTFRTPGWMCDVALHQWGMGARSIDSTPWADYLRGAGGLRRLLRDRWNDLNLIDRFMAWGWRPLPDWPAALVRAVGLTAHSLQFLLRGSGRPDPADKPDLPFELHRRPGSNNASTSRERQRADSA